MKMRIEFRPEEGGRRAQEDEDGCRRLNVCLRKLTHCSLRRSLGHRRRLTFKTFLAARSSLGTRRQQQIAQTDKLAVSCHGSSGTTSRMTRVKLGGRGILMATIAVAVRNSESYRIDVNVSSLFPKSRSLFRSRCNRGPG